MTNLREAAQMALDALEYPGPSWPDARQKAAEALRAALAQPEQEPICVAFIRTLVDIDKDGIETWKDEPLYTAPPQREWVGLTVEEIEAAGKESRKSNLLLPYSFARAIEAKLKEKNNG